MDKIRLNNGVELPLIGFGTYPMHGAECEDSVITAIQAGYRMLDTAEAYGNEEEVGRGIARCGIPREELTLVTKVDFKSYDHALLSVENSLKKLGTDYLDLVLLHWPFANYYAAWRTLEDLYRQGKIRAIGVSNFNSDRLVDLIQYNQVVPAVNQVETHLFCQRKESRRWMAKYGVAPMAYAPLSRGRREDIFGGAVADIAGIHGKTEAQVLLRFLIQEGVMVIPKSSRPERIRGNFDIFDFSLTEEEMERLRALDEDAPLIGNPENPEKVEIAKTW